jgi:RNA polymerase sigma-70 factor (ECF subfamily)
MTLSKEEFIRLALEQIDAVDRIAMSLARDRAEADDLVQETYLNALRAGSNFQLQSFGLRPWLLRILHNLFFNRRKRDRLAPKSLEPEVLETAAQPEPAPREWGDGGLDDSRLQRALEALPGDLRSILLLWAVDELSYREIADVVGIPLGTVMSRLYRARQRIAALLEDHPAASRGFDRPME